MKCGQAYAASSDCWDRCEQELARPVTEPGCGSHLRAGAESYWKGEAREAVGRELFSSERLPCR